MPESQACGRSLVAAATVDVAEMGGNTEDMNVQLNNNWWWLPAKEWAAG